MQYNHTVSKKRNLSLMLDESQPLDLTLPETENTRFHLFKKQRELSEINRVLGDLTAKAKKDDLDWLRENDELMVGLAESFIDDSLVGLEGSPLDGETMKLSLRVMSNLKETLNRFENLISSEVDELEA